ncbi:hypothetical protein BV25DRAFT_1789320, partial [Artomyces pyxidatus]
YSSLPNVPDPGLRQPITVRAVAPLFLCYYAQAVLAILPHTFLLKLALLPLTCWNAWHAAVDYDLAAGAASGLKVPNPERVVCWNYAYVIATITMVCRACDWTFTRTPLRRYEQLEDGSTRERPLTPKNVLTDALELLFNNRGYGWSWSRNPFPHNVQPPSIFSQCRALIFKMTIFDATHYLLQLFFPTLNRAEGDTIFAASLAPFPRYLVGMLVALGAGLVVYTAVDVLYLVAALVGRTILCQPPAHWPPLSNRPWLSTSVAEFWGRRWHQFFRHMFVAVGARPLQTILGSAGGVLGAFGLSAVLHDAGMWGLGRGTEFGTVGGFFVLMGVGVLFERAWERAVGHKVGGLAGWTWTMVWTLGWGSRMVDAWARRGLVGSDFLPAGYRPGKALVDVVL